MRVNNGWENGGRENVVRHDIFPIFLKIKIVLFLTQFFSFFCIFMQPSFPRVFGGNLLDRIPDPRQKPSGMTESNR